MKQTSRYSSIPPAERLPEWLRRPIGNASDLEAVQGVVKQQRLHTICEEGRCPNRGECYAAGTATFLLGGPICTRSCAFCQVDKGQAPHPLDPLEAERVAEAVETLQAPLRGADGCGSRRSKRSRGQLVHPSHGGDLGP